MEDLNFNYKLKKWHFYLLILILSNFLLGVFTNYKLNSALLFFLKIILYLTGVMLFFESVKPFKKIAIYFSFYALSFFVLFVSFSLGGIFATILSSTLLYPIYPQGVKYETDEIIIYEKFQGVMSRCCTYEVVAPKLYFFEKYLGTIERVDPIDPTTDQFTLKNNKLVYKNAKSSQDTIEIIELNQ